MAKCKKEYQQANRGAIAEYQRKYRRANKARLYAQCRTRAESKRRTDPLFAAVCRLRCLTSGAFRRLNYKRTSKTFKLLGCNVSDLLTKWGVTGIPDGYHIDHICPIAQALDVSEAEKLCHWSNLQLLSKEDNLSKGDNKTEEGVALCRTLLGREWAD